MAEIVNLRTVKKRLVRAATATAAKESRVRHGRSKVAKATDQREATRRASLLDGVRRDDERG